MSLLWRFDGDAEDDLLVVALAVVDAHQDEEVVLLRLHGLEGQRATVAPRRLAVHLGIGIVDLVHSQDCEDVKYGNPQRIGSYKPQTGYPKGFKSGIYPEWMPT